MKGFLRFFFFCVTLYLADAYSFLLNDYEDGSETHIYREDWAPFREGMMKKLLKDLNEGKKGPVTIFGSALLDTIILLLDDIPNARSAEGQRRSDLSDLDFRDSSVSPRSGTAGENVYITPDITSKNVPVTKIITARVSQENETNKKDEKCFARQILDLISLLVTNTYDEAIRKSGQAPASPKMLLLLVNELNESLDSLGNIDILDATLIKVFKIFTQLLRGVKADLSSSNKTSPEMLSIVEFLGKLEGFIETYTEAHREIAAAGNSVPAVRVLLDQVEHALEELSEGKTLTNNTRGGDLEALQQFIGELRNTLEFLILGKWDDESESSLLTYFMDSVNGVLEQMIQEMKVSENKPGSLDSFILNVLTAVHARIGKILQVETPIKRML